MNSPGTVDEDYRGEIQVLLINHGDQPFPIRRGVKIGLEIKQAAIHAGVAIQLDFVLSLEVGPGQTRIIGDRDRVRVKSGQQYLAIADDDNS